MAVLSVLLLAGLSVLSTSAAAPLPKAPTSGYGAAEAVMAAGAARAQRLDDPQVLQETKGRLKEFKPNPRDPLPVSAGETLSNLTMPDLTFPPIVAAMDDTDLSNRSTLLQFLIDQPLNYWIRTDYDGHVVWTEGLLRADADIGLVPDPGGGPPQFQIINWGRWQEIDADEDPATGELGTELRVRLRLGINSIERITTRGVFGLFERTDGILLDVSVVVEVDNFAIPDGQPVEVDLYKAFSYRQINHLWMYGFTFASLPLNFSSELEVSEVALDTPPDVIDRIFDPQLPDPFNLSLDGLLGRMLSLSGPYFLRWTITSDVGTAGMAVGFATIENANTLTERTWVELQVAPPAQSVSIPSDLEVELRSPSFELAFDYLGWTAATASELLFRYYEEEVNLTYAEIGITQAPTRFSVALDNFDTPQGPKNRVQFNASAPIALLSFREWVFFDRDLAAPLYAGADLEGLPTKLMLVGDFSLGGGTAAPPAPRPGLGFIGGFLDEMLGRLTSKLARVGLTIRSIPQAVIGAANRQGTMDLSMPIAGEELGAMSFVVTSHTVPKAAGSSLLFFNDEEAVAQSPKPLQPMALAARIERVVSLELDFTTDTSVVASMDRGDPFHVVAIDEVHGARALLTIEALPASMSLRVGDEGVVIDSSESAGSLTYVSQVGPQYLEIALEGLPLHLEVGQKGQDLRLQAHPGQELQEFRLIVTNDAPFEVDEGSYLIVVRSGAAYLLSGELHHLQSLRYRGGAGGFMVVDHTQEEPLFIFLADENRDVSAMFLLDPLPRHFDLSLAGGLQVGGIGLTDVLGVSSVFDLLPMVLELSDLGRQLTQTASDLTYNVALQVGAIGTGSSFALTSSEPTTLVAVVRVGPAPVPPWVHGVYVERQPDGAVGAMVYLRLPTRINYTAESSLDRMSTRALLEDFDPLHPWLTFDIIGSSGRDLQVYADGLPDHLDRLELMVNLTTNQTPGTGRVDGAITLRADQHLGQLLVLARQTTDIDVLNTYYLSSMSSQLDVTIEMADRLVLDLQQSRALPLLVAKAVKLTKYGRGTTLAIAHDVPSKARIEIDPKEDFDIDAPVVQGLPTASISASGHTMDLFVQQEGAAVGSPGDLTMHLQDIPDGTVALLNGDAYELSAPGGLGLLSLRLTNMPYSPSLTIAGLTLTGVDVAQATLRATMVFGSYPQLHFSELDAQSLQLQFDLRGPPQRGARAQQVVMMDLTFQGGWPVAARLSINGASHQRGEGDYHFLMPLPITSLFLTSAG